MGTRNLTAVVINGEYKIAQYGQWDGYPSGQGATALTFLRSKKNRQALKDRLVNCVWIDESKVEAFCKKIGAPDGFMTGDQSEKYHAAFPFLNRDHCAQILALVAATKENEPVELQNSVDFAGDSLFCEWAYVVDFDKNTFEVYKGFNKTPLKSTERFATAPREEVKGKVSEYFPIKLACSYSLDKLPTKAKFLDAAWAKDEE